MDLEARLVVLVKIVQEEGYNGLYRFRGGLLHDSSINELIEVGRETLVGEVGVLS